MVSFPPWPWTVNMEGAGKWFKSQKQALDYVSVNHKRGARSFDVGCFQLNFKWHGSAFSSIEDMFDPNRNALYAANLLKSLFAETGSWETAAGAYHSRTPKYANKYKKRFRQILAGFTGEDLKEMSRVLAEASRQNLYPLLQVRGQGVQHRGSLFQASDAEPAVLLRRSAGALF